MALVMGQGAAMAIEDSVSLAVFLQRGTTSERIPERLQLLQLSRKERADRIQDYARRNGKDADDTNYPPPSSKYKIPPNQVISQLNVTSRRIYGMD